MNVETSELKAIEQAAFAEKHTEILDLSIDDLDLVGGGSFVGVAL